MQQLTIEISDDLRAQLQKLANTTATEESHIIAEALEAYLEGQAYEAEIVQAMEEAKQGVFVENDAVKAWLKTYMR